MIHDEQLINFAVIRTEDGEYITEKTLLDTDKIYQKYKIGTELNGSKIKSITVYPYSKEIEKMYREK